MTRRTIALDYGVNGIDIEVPEDAQIVKREDPPALANVEEEFARVIGNPVAMPPIPKLVSKDCRITIAFDAPPRSGIPRRLAISIILKELAKLGIPDDHVSLICAAGTQRKRTADELRKYLGSEIFNRFWPYRLKSHDCSRDLVYLGETPYGDFVEYNSAIADSDVCFYLGTVVPVSWGGLYRNRGGHRIGKCPKY